MISKEMKVDQMKILDIYLDLATTDKTMKTFLKNLKIKLDKGLHKLNKRQK